MCRFATCTVCCDPTDALLFRVSRSGVIAIDVASGWSADCVGFSMALCAREASGVKKGRAGAGVVDDDFQRVSRIMNLWGQLFLLCTRQYYSAITSRFASRIFHFFLSFE